MTMNDGECPEGCGRIFSDFEDPQKGMNWHIILNHKERAKKMGLIK